jgi:hypothetical protein
LCTTLCEEYFEHAIDHIIEINFAGSWFENFFLDGFCYGVLRRRPAKAGLAVIATVANGRNKNASIGLET